MSITHSRRATQRPTIAEVLLVCFLLAQAAGVIRARFVNSRYFAWAPNDQLVEITDIQVTANGRSLSTPEIIARYRLQTMHHGSPRPGTRLVALDNRALQNPLNHIAQYETTYGKHDGAVVDVKYLVNGRPGSWQWR